MIANENSAWKAVQVSLSDPGNDLNHYDNASTKVSLKAIQDLEAQQRESCGMFLGLEVLDGSMYSVVNNRLVIKSQSEIAVENDPSCNHKSLRKPEGSGTKVTKANSTKTKKRRLDEDKGHKKIGITSASSSTEIAANTQNDTGDYQMNKKNKKECTSDVDDTETSPGDTSNDLSDDASALQGSWMVATGGVCLHPKICEGLMKQGFQKPTPIQAATLPPAILGRRNIVGAAATGSGKTLAYLIPLLQYLLDDGLDGEKKPLRGLIIAPTRELALQVSEECEKIIPRTTVTIVGGLAPHKQARILETRKPPIAVGTPGRLWQMISSRQHSHLNDLSKLRFLVIDEADRMIQQGSFPQLERILESVHTANRLSSDDDSDNDDEIREEEDRDGNRLMSLPGIPGESHVEMWSEKLLQLSSTEEEPHSPLTRHQDEDQSNDDDSSQASSDDVIVDAPVYRQTFVFSATLTLPSSESFAKKKRKKVSKKSPEKSLTGAIAEILEKAHTYGQTKVVDLTSSTQLITKDNDVLVVKEGAKNEKSRLPPGLSLEIISCTQKHKDSHLYAYLLTTEQGQAGPCLIFCNSIVGVKRVGITLQMLGLPVRMLHANMPQKARFKAIESLQSGSERAIVVSTDVAARGLDIPNMATVVHYDVARGVNTFIHRSGRTARGMGENAIGCSLSLVSAGEEKFQKVIFNEIGKDKFSNVHLDSRLLSGCQARVNLASKIVSCREVESRTERNNKWFKDAASEAGLELDDDLYDAGLAGGDRKDQQRYQEAKRAQILLRDLLSQPLITRRFGKFMSCNNSISIPAAIDGSSSFTSQRGKKKQRRR